MSHKDVLKQLFPLELGGMFDADTALEGKALDTAQARAEGLLRQIFADMAAELLPDWERVCGLTPGSSDPLQLRQLMVVKKLRELGDIKSPDFVALAAALGFTVTIVQLTPCMCGWSRCCDRLYTTDIWWIWQINVLGTPSYYFRSGQSAAGERLSWFPAATALETLFNDIKPADVWLWFVYPS
jgi:uncharacterized protein YmfQ (DUF2313 family)